jgi:hypothetical protein
VLRESEDDPWAEIEITRVNIGFHLVSDNTMQPGACSARSTATRIRPITQDDRFLRTGGGRMVDF